MSYESISLVEMDDFLRQRRFKPVDLYFRRRPVKEWVYERRLPQNANHFVRVYTTIQRYGGKTDQSRDVGKDAIRVQVIYRDEKGETLVSMPKRVNRISTWRDNLDDRLKEVAESLPKVKMDSRGEPMTLRKKRGNLFWGSRDYPAFKETRRYGSEQEILIGKPGEVAWRAMNPNDYALGLESGYLTLDKTMGGRGHYAMLGKTPTTFQIHWRGYPMFEIDMEGLKYATSGNLQWNQPRHTNIQIMQDIPIEKVTPYDSELGIGEVSKYIPRSKTQSYDKLPELPEVKRDRSWTTRFDEVMERPGFWDSYKYNSEDTTTKSEDGRKGVAVLIPDESTSYGPQISGTVYFEETNEGVKIDYQIRGLYDGPHGFHVHEYGDLTDGCTSACAHFNPDGATHGGLDTKIRHFGDLGNIESKDRLAEGSLFLPNGRLDGSKYSILGRMIIVHADRDDLGEGGDEESLKTGNAGKRLACGVIGLADPKETVDKKAETVRECCQCGKTEGITTIQAGTYCYECLPINLGAESSQEIKEYITSIHDGDFLWRDRWDDLEFTLQTLSMEIFEEYKDPDNVDGAWEDSPVNSHRLEDTLSQFRWEGDGYPPVVLELDKNGYYDIIDGYHRLNALQILDSDTVEAWVGIPASTFEAEDNYDATYGKKQAKIRRRLKNKIMKQNIMGTKANKWSARKSQELKRQYEKACEKAGLASYKGSKTAKQDDLSNWSKQKWTTASGKKSSVTGEPYFPEKAVAALKNRGLYAKAKRQKRSANKANRNARYSDDIREVVGQFRAEEYLNPNDPEMINILLLEWAMKTNQTYDSLTIQKGLANYIDVSPYDFVRHMQNQDLISLKPAVNLGWNALVPADFLYYLQDKDRDHWINMKSRAVGIERYKYLKEKISADRYWLSDSKKDYHRWSFQSAINYQNI